MSADPEPEVGETVSALDQPADESRTEDDLGDAARDKGGGWIDPDTTP